MQQFTHPRPCRSDPLFFRALCLPHGGGWLYVGRTAVGGGGAGRVVGAGAGAGRVGGGDGGGGDGRGWGGIWCTREQMGNEIIKRREAKIEGGEKDTNQDPNFVKELLALHDKYMAVVNEQFAGNSLLQKALKEVGRFFGRSVCRSVGRSVVLSLLRWFLYFLFSLSENSAGLSFGLSVGLRIVIWSIFRRFWSASRKVLKKFRRFFFFSVVSVFSMLVCCVGLSVGVAIGLTRSVFGRFFFVVFGRLFRCFWSVSWSVFWSVMLSGCLGRCFD